MAAYLPQNDPHAKRRQKDLTTRQSEYLYCLEYVSPLALVHDVPLGNEFSIEWMAELGQRLLVALENLPHIESVPELREHHPQVQHSCECLARSLPAANRAESGCDCPCANGSLVEMFVPQKKYGTDRSECKLAD